MDMILRNTNSKIRKTLSRFRNNHPAFINCNKNTYVKETDHIQINALFGLMHLRGLLTMNLQRVEYLFADEGYYAFGAIMSKNSSISLAISHLTTTLIVKTAGQQIVLPQCDKCGSSSIQTLANMLHQVKTWQLVKRYILCNIRLLSVNTILISQTSMMFY